jgi:2-iminobutanoate/2-iminopropanoate deaminase
MVIAALARFASPPILAALALAACSAAPRRPVFSPSPDAALATLPFSEAVEVDGLLFVSGMIGVAPGTLDVVPGGMTQEAEQTLANLRAVLERHGCTFADVVKATVFLTDMAEWPAFNDVWRRAFANGRFPARSALGANGLARGARVEVDFIAVVPR